MRKYLKDQCIETLHSITEAHKELENLLKNSEFDSSIALLEECQNAAISVGTSIEGSEGKGTDEIEQLEKYCEKIWLISQDINSKSSKLFYKEKAEIDSCINSVINGMIKNIPTIREVVFLPYKASMWDSLESVWKEESSKENTNALVIPIPYFDKNSKGELERYHFEADLFPEDVPVIQYYNYNIEEKHPDVIYIHNPYDNSNYVTSVHPDYYSSKLKKLTDKLVYIPYFVLEDISEANPSAALGAEHFIATPAVINAHEVIVQSEGWRQGYIYVMLRYTGEGSRAYWENKIKVRLSPKLERVRNLKGKDFILPEDWLTKVIKKNGQRKKIILYNTGIAALLENKEEMLQKIERVLETFQKSQDEITLLWRPHPLMEATLASIHPELLEVYKKIVKKYLAEDWGIYDDSSELDRAIAVSDAYYGDPSSIVQLYKETGKPIMIQNCYV